MSTMNTVRHVTLEQWLEEAVAKFGKDGRKWKFKCPSCGHVQSLQDFYDLGMTSEQATHICAFSCIGRWRATLGREAVKMGEQDKGAGCNYAGGGLFKLNPVHITIKDGEVIQVMEWAA